MLQTRACFVVWLVFLLTVGQSCSAEILLSSDTDISTEGYFVLSWHSDSASSSLYLQQALTENFNNVKTINLTGSGSITLTGLTSGEYFYRIDSGQEQSNIVSIVVAHHSLTKAFTFFILGFALFSVLLVTIFLGHKAEKSHYE